MRVALQPQRNGRQPIALAPGRALVKFNHAITVAIRSKPLGDKQREHLTVLVIRQRARRSPKPWDRCTPEFSAGETAKLHWRSAP